MFLPRLDHYHAPPSVHYADIKLLLAYPTLAEHSRVQLLAFYRQLQRTICDQKFGSKLYFVWNKNNV